jgi:16S rRNA (cytidine1402-2'-O)-methyltransferase
MNENKKAFLAIIATPIGNLGDITLRAIETLRNSQVIAAEDTRHSLQLLNSLGIKKPLISCRAFNEEKEAEKIIRKVLDGESVSYVCDAGTPCISDPGSKLVSIALNSGIEPLFIPGVSALMFAASACALPVAKFAFYGFPPIKSGRRRKFLEKIHNEDKTIFVYESPHRISKLLSEISEIIGAETRIAVIREATKMYEESLRGSVGEIIFKTKDKNWKGEIVVAIYPPSAKNEEKEDDNEKDQL